MTDRFMGLYRSISLLYDGFIHISLVLICVLCIPLNSFAKPAFNADRAFKSLQKQCEFGPRPPGSPAHKRTKNYLISELKKQTQKVALQNFTHKSNNVSLDLTNIIAIFGPETDKKVLLAAHWDTRPFADRDPDPKKRKLPIPGANDGASGVAVLLELSRVFHLNPPPVQVIMVLFDGEDYGKETNEMFLGSRYFARNMDKRWIPGYGVLIDMIGDKNLDIYMEQNSVNYAPDVVKKAWQTAKELGLNGFYNKVGPAIMDDHIPLIEAGIECIDIIDFNYPYWHTLGDTPDKCSPKSLETVGRLLMELIYR